MTELEKLIEHSKLYLDKHLRPISNLANLSAYLYDQLDQVNWVGFYLYEDDDLYLGPFQGKPACTNIQMGKGVCGTAAAKRETLVVDDVHKFLGHITCDSASNSEIVIPVMKKNGELFGVLDIDSPVHARFDEGLKLALEDVVNLLVDIL